MNFEAHPFTTSPQDLADADLVSHRHACWSRLSHIAANNRVTTAMATGLLHERVRQLDAEIRGRELPAIP